VWSINVELLIAFKTEISQVATDIRTQRQLIIDKIDEYPTLDTTTGVVFAMITEGREPELVQMGARTFWRQIMIAKVEERATVTYAE